MLDIADTMVLRGRCGGTQKGPSSPGSGARLAAGSVGRRSGFVVAVQHVWVEVESVWPDNGAQLGVDADPPEVLRVAQRLGHRAPEDTREVNDSLTVVVDPQPQAIRLQGLDMGHSDHGLDARAVGRSQRAVRERQRDPSW